MNIETNYNDLLQVCITQIQTARQSIAVKINQSTISVYWQLGKLLSEKVQAQRYGSGVINQLSVDLKNVFPDMGLSPRNLWNMKKFYERFSTVNEKLQRSVAVLPWRHNLLLLQKVEDDQAVEFYANQVISKGWSRDLLLNALKMDSYAHAQKQLKSNNFDQTLPEAHADYANEVFKSSYNLGFLGITEPVKERELEKSESENPSIGIILCADKDHLDVEIALQDIHKPIGVADYQLLLPKEELQTLILNEINANEQDHE
jgi:predicted nuclease of restriction endonuclease-like (RecB) superfamily